MWPEGKVEVGWLESWSEERGQRVPWVLSMPLRDLVDWMMERVQHRENQIAEECHLAFKH